MQDAVMGLSSSRLGKRGPRKKDADVLRCTDKLRKANARQYERRRKEEHETNITMVFSGKAQPSNMESLQSCNAAKNKPCHMSTRRRRWQLLAVSRSQS